MPNIKSFMRFRYWWVVIVAISILGVGVWAVYAYKIENNNEPNQGVFAVSPSRVEVNVGPGETATQTIIVVNRLGRMAKFLVSVEAFAGSQNPDVGVVFSSPDSPMSAARWVTPELTEFTLEAGQRMFFGVTISPPADVNPGGHYGAVFFESQPVGDDTGGANIKLITRVGALLLINVKGPVDERGRITDFSTDLWRLSGPIDFNLIFQNDGNTHQAPQGTIEIRNLFGTVVGQVAVDPWYVLPNSQRRKKVTWERSWLWGYYTATAKITHGRSTVSTEQATIHFWVVPWRLVAMIVLILAAGWLLWRKYLSRLQVRLTPKS